MALIPFPVSPARCAGLIGAGMAILSSGAWAQTPIGSAALVQNDVRGHTGGEIFRINRGDRVILDQIVQTASDSRAKLVFLDTTNMSVGPDSIVKLDQFVYNGNGTAQSVSINVARGAFRFFSGSSEHRAYKVTTPQAVIGVRGTTYDVLVANGQTYIKLQEGAVTACTRMGSTCRDLDRPGDYLVVSNAGIEGPLPSNGQTWDFGNLCGGAVDLCRKTQFAMNMPPTPPPAGGGYRPPQPPGFQPPIRTASLQPTRPSIQPPYATPPGQHLPPLVNVDPPTHAPPIYIPPYRPPHASPPQRPYPPRPGQEGKPYPGQPGAPRPPYPPRPPQEGKPLPGKPGTPRPPLEGRPWPTKPGKPPILRAGDVRMTPNRAPYRPRWTAPNRPQTSPRVSLGMRASMTGPARQAQTRPQIRWATSQNLRQGPRLSNLSRPPSRPGGGLR